MNRRNGLTLIEVMVALALLLLALFTIYQVFLGGSAARAAARVRMAALKYGEMEIEEITATAFDDLPPEKHSLKVELAPDALPVCRIRLHNIPIRDSVKVVDAEAELLSIRYTVDYRTGTLVLPADLRGREVLVSYAYEYPRRDLLVVPKSPPHRVRLSTLPISKVMRVVDSTGRPLPVIVDHEQGSLTFKEQDAGKSAMVEYRGKDDNGRVEGTYLSEDLRSDSAVDTGIKLIKLEETWEFDGRRNGLELSCVQTR